MNKDTYTRNNVKNFYDRNSRANCGSFALNVKEWFYPYLAYSDPIDNSNIWDEDVRSDLMEDLALSGCTREEIMEVILMRDWEYILETCPFLEEIELKDAVPADRIIAYRLMLTVDSDDADSARAVMDEDFHFRVRINGFWFDKCGGRELRFLGTKVDEHPWVTDDLYYDSQIKYARFIET